MPATSGTRRGNGAGWGGDAKGAGTGGQAAPFAAGNDTRVSAAVFNHEPDAQAYRADRRLMNRQRREAAWAALDALVSDPTAPAHFHAAKETLNRLDGMPVSNVNMKADVRRTIAEFTDEELAALAGSDEGEDGTEGEDGGAE